MRVKKHEVKLEDIEENRLKLDGKYYACYSEMHVGDSGVYIYNNYYNTVQLTNIRVDAANYILYHGMSMIESCCGVEWYQNTKPTIELTEVEQKFFDTVLQKDIRDTPCGIKYTFVSPDTPKEEIERLEKLGFQKNRTLKGGTIEYRHKNYMGSEDPPDDYEYDDEDDDY